MAGGQICRAQANSFLDSLFYTMNSVGNKAYHYIGLGTTDTVPDVNGGNITEPSADAGYERRELKEMGTASDGQIQNESIIFMGESLGDGWGEIGYFFISKAKAATPVFWAPLNSAVKVPGGYVPIFRKNALIVGLDKPELDIPTS